mmetsp:Transcript_84273/g.271802  ORF Transcript_84273/g.271802 Transcript_84273/m.271802 type:complete len:222 (-) Transcript_84273:1600-2265(-)
MSDNRSPQSTAASASSKPHSKSAAAAACSSSTKCSRSTRRSQRRSSSRGSPDGRETGYVNRSDSEPAALQGFLGKYMTSVLSIVSPPPAEPAPPGRAICPEPTGHNEQRLLAMAVLPEPDGPQMRYDWPSVTRKLRSRSTGTLFGVCTSTPSKARTPGPASTKTSAWSPGPAKTEAAAPPPPPSVPAWSREVRRLRRCPRWPAGVCIRSKREYNCFTRVAV